MKIDKLREKTIDQLGDSLVEFQKEFFNLRFQKISGELENTSRIKEVRRVIAKIKTLLKERQVGENNA